MENKKINIGGLLIILLGVFLLSDWFTSPEVGSVVKSTLKSRSYTYSESVGIYTLKEKILHFLPYGIMGSFFVITGLYMFFFPLIEKYKDK